MQEAVAALARHVCLKAPDRAEPRANAVRAAATMVPLLPQWEQEQFVGFVFHLSRSSKVRAARVRIAPNRTRRHRLAAPHSATRPLAAAHPPTYKRCLAAPLCRTSGVQIGQRCLAVGLARELLMYLPEPFQQSTFQAAAAAAADTEDAAGGGAGAGMVPAPWSVVCLAALLHRWGARTRCRVRGRLSRAISV